MSIQYWFILTILFTTIVFTRSTTTEFSAKDVCDNVKRYYNFLYPFVHKIPMDFHQGDRYLHGKGHVALSPNFTIYDCKAKQISNSSSITIHVNMKDKLNIMMDDSPWIKIDDAVLGIEMISKSKYRYKEVMVTSLDLDIGKAYINNTLLGYLPTKDVKTVLRYALEVLAKSKKTKISDKFTVSEKFAVEALKDTFMYHMYRLC